MAAHTIVVLYVTRSGHSRAIAEQIGGRLGVEAHEIADLVSRRGFLGFMKSGAQSSMKGSTPIADPGVDLAKADTVVLVHPVWAANVCPPVRTWLNAHKAELAGKRIGLVVSNKGSDGAPIKAKFEEEFGPVASFTAVREDLDPAGKTLLLDGFLEAVRR